MLVFVLHGFGTTGDGSIMCQRIVALTMENNATAYAPTYPTNNPHLAHILLADFVNEKNTGEPMCFVGISLGGFWARHLARLHPGSHMILINPCMNPWLTLRKHMGTNKNFANGSQFSVTETDVTDHLVYRVDNDHGSLHATIIVASDDEIVDPNKAIEIFTNRPNIMVHSMIGGHRFIDNRDEVIDIVAKTIFPKSDNE